MDWETVLKVVGIIVTLLLGLLGLRPEWRKMASTSQFTLKRDLEIIELMKRIDKDDPRYETVKKSINAKIDKKYLPAEKTLRWSILGSLLLFIGFSFWSWYIVKDGFTWWVIITGYIAFSGLYFTVVELYEWYDPLLEHLPPKKVGRGNALTIIDTFTRFIDDNKDELTALRIIYGKPCNTRYLTHNEIDKLAGVMKKPPYKITPGLVWRAYAILTTAEEAKKAKEVEKQTKKAVEITARGKAKQEKGSRAKSQRLPTDVVSLIWLTIGKIDVLEPFPEIVNRRFNNWLTRQKKAGRTFTAEQKDWLKMIKEHIATSLSISMDDFELVSFYKKGGAVKANNLFGEQLDELLEELNEVLVA